jgi:hypothetical protein
MTHKCNGLEMKAVGRHPFIWLPLHESLTMKVCLKIGSELRMLIQWNLLSLSLHFRQLCFQNMGPHSVHDFQMNRQFMPQLSPDFTTMDFFFCEVFKNKVYT